MLQSPYIIRTTHLHKRSRCSNFDTYNGPLLRLLEPVSTEEAAPPTLNPSVGSMHD